MKILVNLLSKQMPPNLIAILEETPDEVVALTTPEFADQVGRFQNFTGTKHTRHEFRPYDLAADLQTMQQLLGTIPESAQVCINFTGGTKIMSLAAALPGLGGRRQGIQAIYIDTSGDCIHRISRASDGKMQFHPPTKLAIPIPFQAYVALKGETISSLAGAEKPAAKERRPLARVLAESSELRSIFSGQKKMFDTDRNGHSKCKPQYERNFMGRTAGRKSRQGHLAWDKAGFSLHTPSGKEYRYPHPDGGEFFTGKWLEEYVAAQLLDSGEFNQVLTQVVLSLRPETVAGFREDRRHSPFTDKNELDVVVTRGRKAGIIECKAGNITQDHVYKLATLRDYLLGPFGKAFLACRFAPANPGIVEKCRDVGIQIIEGHDLKKTAKLVSAALA